jgi:hypothetical protein
MESLFTARVKEYEESETNYKMVSNLNVKKLPLAMDEGRSSIQDEDTMITNTGRRSMPLRSHDPRELGKSTPASQTETLWYNDNKPPRIQLPNLAQTLGSMRKTLEGERRDQRKKLKAASSQKDFMYGPTLSPRSFANYDPLTNMQKLKKPKPCSKKTSQQTTPASHLYSALTPPLAKHQESYLSREQTSFVNQHIAQLNHAVTISRNRGSNFSKLVGQGSELALPSFSAESSKVSTTKSKYLKKLVNQNKDL